jgi:hypothetical protein
VVGVDGFLGLGERQVAIPLDELRLGGDRLVSDLTKDRVQSMQAYSQAGYDILDPAGEIGSTLDR